MYSTQMSLLLGVLFLGFISLVPQAVAQQKKAVTFQQQVQNQRSLQPGVPSNIPSVDYRLLAQFQFANAYPYPLNDAREEYLDDGTGTTRGGFYNLSGFTVGFAYRLFTGFLGLEFGRVRQDLAATAILAPAGTPKEIVAKLNASVNAALRMDDVRAKLQGAGIEIQGGTPEQFGNVIRTEVEKWGRIVNVSSVVGLMGNPGQANYCASKAS